MKGTFYQLIKPNDFLSIQNLKKSEAAFPKLEFSGGKLNRKRTTIKAAYTNISKNVNKNLISELEIKWNNHGDILWQNDMLNTLDNKINSMIEEYSTNPSALLLKKIFIYIQLWGGNTCRDFFNKDGGFDENYNAETYKIGVELSSNDPIKALEKLLELNQMGIAFATKHIYFWSRKIYPIYDSIIAMLVFGRTVGNKIEHYKEYINSLEALGNDLNLKSDKLERSLFNWYESKEGKIWFCIRNSYQK